jgi:hypothetical protein
MESYTLNITDPLGNTINYNVSDKTTMRDIFSIFSLNILDDSIYKINGTAYQGNKILKDIKSTSEDTEGEGLITPGKKIIIQDTRIIIKKLILELLDATTSNNLLNYDKLKSDINRNISTSFSVGPKKVNTFYRVLVVS